VHQPDVGKLLLAGEAARGLARDLPVTSSVPLGKRRLPKAS